MRSLILPLTIPCAVATACVGAGTPSPAAPAAGPNDVQVMVLGTYHMAGGQSDLINVKVDSVLTPRRQRELAALAKALATFRPTIVFTERVTEAPAYIDPKFAAFTAATLLKNPNERAQIAYRLAKLIGIDRVHGIDEQPADGEPDYFPFGAVMAHVEATGQKAEFDTYFETAKQMVTSFSAATRADSIAMKLIKIQRGPMSAPDFYYELARFDVGEAQPGAELQAYWFMRNAKIWSKLRDLVRPGDRVVVVYGAGHKFWLDHMARHSTGFVSVDPVPYLEAAEKKR